MRHFRVPAVSIAVIDNYRVVWVHAAGLRNVASNAPALTTTLFQAASMSKAVAAAGFLRLFEDKQLDLDADVNTMLRSWHVPQPPDTSSERVTLRRLLSHTAGVNVHGFIGYDRDATLPTLVQVLDGVAPANSEAIRVTAVPGSKTDYSGGGTSIAQQVAVDVTGEPFPTFMQQTVLRPLDMTSRYFRSAATRATVVTSSRRILSRRKSGASRLVRVPDYGGSRSLDDADRFGQIRHSGSECAARPREAAHRRRRRTADDHESLAVVRLRSRGLSCLLRA